MRFVKNLIATAALATVAFDGGVAGLPAGSNNNAVPRLRETEGSSVATNFAKDSVIVPGASTSASIIPHFKGGHSNIIEPTPFPSNPAKAVTVLEGPDAEISVPAFGADEVKHTVTVTESTPVPSNPVTVTGLDERQMLPITSSVIGARQMLPPPRPKLGNLDERQMLPPPKPKLGSLDERQMLPPPKPKLGSLDERQMLPPPKPKLGNLDERQMLPPPKPKLGHLNVETDAQVTYLPKPPVGPVSGHPAEAVEARQMLPISSNTPNVNARQMLPISSTVVTYTPPGTPFGRQPDPKKFEEAMSTPVGNLDAISTVTATSLHTVTATPSSTSQSSAAVYGSVVPEPSTSIITFSTAHLPNNTASDNCTVPATLSLPLGETTATVTSTVTLTPSWLISGSSWIPNPALTTANVTNVTTITTDNCNHVTCGPTTITSTLTSTSSSSTSKSTTSTADAASTSVDTCTESSTSSTSSELTTEVTVTTHITTTITSTGSKDVGPPRLTPPAITARDPQTTVEQGPPRLTPPAIGGGPEAGPLDPRPPFSAEAEEDTAWVDAPVPTITHDGLAGHGYSLPWFPSSHRMPTPSAEPSTSLPWFPSSHHMPTLSTEQPSTLETSVVRSAAAA